MLTDLLLLFVIPLLSSRCHYSPFLNLVFLLFFPLPKGCCQFVALSNKLIPYKNHVLDCPPPHTHTDVFIRGPGAAGLRRTSSGSESCCSADQISLFRQIVLDLRESKHQKKTFITAQREGFSLMLGNF